MPCTLQTAAYMTRSVRAADSSVLQLLLSWSTQLPCSARYFGEKETAVIILSFNDTAGAVPGSCYVHDMASALRSKRYKLSPQTKTGWRF